MNGLEPTWLSAGGAGDTVTIATTNLAHLSRFPGIDAQTWDGIR